MEEWKRLEFEYAKRLRECQDVPERRRLYGEAYDRVMSLVTESYETDNPEARTAGTKPNIVRAIAKLADPSDDVLEVGCGRGFTCLKLAPEVRSIVGTDVSTPMVDEARELMAANGITNVSIEQVSGMDLVDRFEPQSFSLAVSIDVVEHLHPDDARDHMEQVFQLLRPGGRYMIFMPNRLDGPHDITAQVFPGARSALGFHLNESTYGEMARVMKHAGFEKLRSVVWTKSDEGVDRVVAIPMQASVGIESVYRTLPKAMKRPQLGRFLRIRLVGSKPR